VSWLQRQMTAFKYGHHGPCKSGMSVPEPTSKAIQHRVRNGATAADPGSAPMSASHSSVPIDGKGPVSIVEPPTANRWRCQRLKRGLRPSMIDGANRLYRTCRTVFVTSS